MGGCLSLKKKKVEVVVKENEKKESSKEVQVGNSGSGSDKSTSVIVPVDGRPAIGENFTYQELADATTNFSPDTLLGQGGFGSVHSGFLKRTQQVVAVKKLDKDSAQGDEEYFMEIRMLSNLDHPNLVKLIGFCAEGDEKLIVYEFMPLGSLNNHLHDLPSDKQPLDWNTRMKIAEGVAKGLEYLHKEMPPVIHRDLKSSNILLGPGYHPKLSDFGLARLGPEGDKTHVSTRVMGTHGYCAPEYMLTGRLTLKSEIYSFGVVLLELITGRKPVGDHTLVEWARPKIKERKDFHTLVDPQLHGNYPKKGLHQALVVSELCLREQHENRPEIDEVVNALSFLAS
ncbi:hypothetical protein AQUCO_00300847v1 [Aquilegia coerulea]|uniref:Protein kinase domain-containing protein n=1 Tax=Aquilegia coerulea TaxID=218851 RepID=A0A2G5F136_AQUCA|nr:hypothetical protein AQUCO_00300847v1 [Aquilegia coerulea]